MIDPDPDQGQDLLTIHPGNNALSWISSLALLVKDSVDILLLETRSVICHVTKGKEGSLLFT